MTQPLPDVLFFGCYDARLGHYLRGPGGMLADARLLPHSLSLRRLDGALAPKDRRQVEGRARLHHLDGWTVVAWWDRSVDSRRGSNGALLVRGTHTLASVLLAAGEAFPEMLPRFATLELAT